MTKKSNLSQRGYADFDKDKATENLCLHILIHATKKETIDMYKGILNLNQKQMEKVNKLRAIIGLESI